MTYNKTPMGRQSVTLWAVGLLLVVNGLACAAGAVGATGLVFDFAAAAAGDVGPSVQLGIGGGLLGIRRRM
jgi:hypothetical protein